MYAPTARTLDQAIANLSQWRDSGGAVIPEPMVVQLMGREESLLKRTLFVGRGSEGVVLFDDSEGKHVYKIGTLMRGDDSRCRHVARETCIGFIVNALRANGLQICDFLIGTKEFGAWMPPSSLRVPMSCAYSVSVPRIEHGPSVDYTDLLPTATALNVRASIVGAKERMTPQDAAGAYNALMRKTYKESTPFSQVWMQKQPYVPGSSLDTLLRRGTLTSSDNSSCLVGYVSVSLQMLAALAAIGFVHCDLNTHNILITAYKKLPDAYAALTLDGKPLDLSKLQGQLPVFIDLSESMLSEVLLRGFLSVSSSKLSSLVCSSRYPYLNGSADTRRLGLYILYNIISSSSRVARRVVRMALRMCSVPTAWFRLARAKAPLTLASNWDYESANLTIFMSKFAAVYAYSRLYLISNLTKPQHALLTSDKARSLVLQYLAHIMHDINTYHNALLMTYSKLAKLDDRWLPKSAYVFVEACI